MLRGLAGVMARNVALRYGVLQHYGGGVAGQAALRRVLTSCAVWLRVLRGMVRGARCAVCACAGLAPACSGCAARAWFELAEGDAPFAHVVGGKFNAHVIARQNADVVLAHFAAGVGNDGVAVLKRYAVARVGQYFVNNALHFD